MFLDYKFIKHSYGRDDYNERKNFSGLCVGLFFTGVLLFLIYFFFFIIIPNDGATGWYWIHIVLMRPIHLFSTILMFSVTNCFIAIQLLKDQNYKRTKYFWLFVIPGINIITYTLEFLVSCVFYYIFSYFSGAYEAYIASDQNEYNNMIKRLTDFNKKQTEKLKRISKNMKIDNSELIRDYKESLNEVRNIWQLK